MAKIIEAKAIISGEDRLSKVIDGIEKKLKGVGKGLNAAANVDKLNTSLANTKKQLESIERLHVAQGKLASSKMGLAGAQARADQMSAALAAARRSGDASATSALVAQHRTAQRAVTQATAAIERQSAAVQASKRVFSEFGVPTQSIVSHQRALRSSYAQTTAAIQQQASAQERVQQQSEAAATRSTARQTLAGMGGLYLGHKVSQGTDATLHTYREFDKYSRQTEAFGNFSKAEMQQIIAMAIHGDPNTRFNDIQWLQGAKALGGRGVKAGSVMGILPEAGRYAQAMDTDLPEGVAGIEGSLFGFQRDLSTPDKAQAAARRTADLQVTAAKAFGLTHHDLKGGYEYGALGANMTGLSEEKLLAFMGLGKKLNIEGSAQGNAWRAMTGKFLSPTRKGREAMASVGVDYSSFQKMPDQLPLDNFKNMIAQQYGVKLDQGASAKLGKAFQDKKTFGDAGAFAIAVKDAVKGQVGAVDAKSANKVVGSAERFRQSNVEKVDVNGLFDALMEKMAGGNLALANAVFGEKQGTRIMAALRDGDVWRHSVKKLEDAPEGKAREVSEKMSGGFEGASARWEKALKNLETAFGRSLDNGGEGGFLTGLVDQSAKLVQSLAEMNSGVLQVGAGLSYIGGKAATASGTIALVGAAFSLKGSAAALTGAAMKLGATGNMPNVAGKMSEAAKTGGGAAAGAAATGGVAGPVLLAGGVLAGVVADQASTQAFGTVADSARALNDLSRKRKASDFAADTLGYQNPLGRGLQMPYGASSQAGFPTRYEAPRNAFSRFLNGPDMQTQMLPGFGAGPKRMPVAPTMSVPLPPTRPASLGGVPSVPQGPITAEVKSPVPVSVTGQLTGTGTLTGNVTVTASPLLTARLDGLDAKITSLTGKVSSVAANGPGSTGKSSPDAGKGGRD